MDQELKVRENRARRAAIRQGFELQKSQRRDKNALDYGRFMLVDAMTEAPVFGHEPRPFSATLDEIEERLRIV